MAPRFVFCPSCNRPAHVHERACPFCDAPLAADPSRSVGVGVALSVGLSLVAGCERAPVAPEAPRAARPDAAVVPVGHAPAETHDAAPADASTTALDAASADVGEGTIGLGSIGTIGVYGAPSAPRALGSGYGVYGSPPAALRGQRVVRALPPSVQGELSPEVVRRVVMRNVGQVQRCIEEGQASRPGLAGRVTVRFVVNGEGAVIGSGVESSTLAAPTVEQCVAAATRRWQFPAPERGVVMVHQPFNVQGRAR